MRVLVRSSFILTLFEPRIVYNGQESERIISIQRDRKTNIFVGQFMATATGLGANGTYRSFQFSFTLLSLHNDASIRVVVVNPSGVKTYSSFLKLTVLRKSQIPGRG